MKALLDLVGVQYEMTEGSIVIHGMTTDEVAARVLALEPEADLSTFRVEWAVPSDPTRVRCSVEVS